MRRSSPPPSLTPHRAFPVALRPLPVPVALLACAAHLLCLHRAAPLPAVAASSSACPQKRTVSPSGARQAPHPREARCGAAEVGGASAVACQVPDAPRSGAAGEEKKEGASAAVAGSASAPLRLLVQHTFQSAQQAHRADDAPRAALLFRDAARLCICEPALARGRWPRLCRERAAERVVEGVKWATGLTERCVAAEAAAALDAMQAALDSGRYLSRCRPRRLPLMPPADDGGAVAGGPGARGRAEEPNHASPAAWQTSGGGTVTWGPDKANHDIYVDYRSDPGLKKRLSQRVSGDKSNSQNRTGRRNIWSTRVCTRPTHGPWCAHALPKASNQHQRTSIGARSWSLRFCFC